MPGASLTDPINTALHGALRSLEELAQTSENITRPAKDTDLAENIVRLNSAKRSYEANLAVIRAADALAQTTIDLLI